MKQIPIVTTETVPGRPPGFFVTTVVSSKTLIHHIGQQLNYFQEAYLQAVEEMADVARESGADAIVGLRISTSRHPGDTVSGMKDDTLVAVGTAVSYEELSASELAKRVQQAKQQARARVELQADEDEAKERARQAKSDPLRPGKCDCGEIERTPKNTMAMSPGIRLCNICGITF